MKVIGKSEAGYLLAATEAELNRLAGCPYGHNTPWGKANPQGRGVPMGTEFAITERFDRIAAIEAAEAKVREGAAALRALAGLAEKTLPTAVSLPTPGAEAESG